MLAIIGLYIIPVVVFLVVSRRVDYIIDIFFSVISFIFFSPTYHNILNIYALCRIDDISWGTKGIDASVSSHKK
jgi:chitin synthase